MKQIMMIRPFLITAFLISILPDSNCQKYVLEQHCYTIGTDYRTLYLEQNNKYELQIGIGDKIIAGQYITKNDTLILSSYNFDKYSIKLSEAENKMIKHSFGKYEILDSLLIPINFDFSVDSLPVRKQDDKKIEEYIFCDSFAFDLIRFHSDSTFEYKSGFESNVTTEKGRWYQNGNVITISPEKPSSRLEMITENYQLIVIGQFLVFTNPVDEHHIRYYYYSKL